MRFLTITPHRAGSGALTGANIRALAGGLAALLLGDLVLSGCAGRASETTSRSHYEATFKTTRLQDHSPLISVSVPLTIGQTASVRTDSRIAREQQPALPQFSARLTTTRTSGVYQLITRVKVLEAVRNKKGKMVRSKRYEGALLPVRIGEAQSASAAGDPVQIEVKVSTH